MSSFKQLIFATAFLGAAASALAQSPPDSQPDDRAVTIGIIRNPDANAPDEIVRKIPAPQPRKRGNTDDSGTDLANPRGKGDATPAPGTPDPVVPTIPLEPGNTDSPSVPGGSAPGSGPTTPEPPASPSTPSTPDTPNTPDSPPGEGAEVAAGVEAAEARGTSQAA